MNSSRTPWFGTLFLLIVVALAAVGCARSAPSSQATASGPASDSAAKSPSGDRARVLSVDTALVVDRVDDRTREIRDAVDRAGGYVTDATSFGIGDERSGHMDVRIPADQLRTFRAALATLGEVLSDSERAEDVTEQRADIKARLHNARAQEKRVLELLAAKTSSLGEVIEAEKELARVRESVERLEAQDRTLDAKVTFATVRISISGRASAAWQTPGASIASSARAGLRGAAAFFVYLAMAIVTVGPTVLPIALLIVGIVMAARRLSRRRLAERMASINAALS